MKYVKRISCFVMALVMICSMLAVSVSAVQVTDDMKGSITITGINPNSTAEYRVYKMMSLKEYVIAGKESRFVYEMESNWENFFNSSEVQKFISWVDDNNEAAPNKYFSWITNNNPETEQKNIDEFAALALAYAQNPDNNVEVIASNVDGLGIQAKPGGTNTEAPTLVFEGLPLGYYLIDSNVGILCGLTTTAPNAAMNAKNVIPTIEKQVKENSDNRWTTANDASVGEIVEFRSTINVTAGAENFVLHDYMSEGLTFIRVSKVEHNDKTTNHTEDALTKNFCTVKSGETLPSCQLEGAEHPCAFHIEFTPDFYKHIKPGDSIIVYYEAQVTKDAFILPDYDTNASVLEYGVGNFTVPSVTQTYTYGFDIVKTDGTNALLPGAGFKIYTAAEGGDYIPVRAVMTEDGKNIDYYRVIDYVTIEDGKYINADGEEIEDVIIMVRDEDTSIGYPGVANVHGLDSGTYYLEEVVKPDGYNGLQQRQAFTIDHNNKFATFTGDSDNPIYSTGSGVHVVNNAGVMMPETGGIGTTLFYVGGGIMVFAALVLLITKKRMAAKD